MKIEIYNKYWINDMVILSDYPCSVYCNVRNIEITQNFIYGNINGEQLTIKKDCLNYAYFILG